MLTVRFEDYREVLIELLNLKLRAAAEGAAGVLAQHYRDMLSEDAPPHSGPGQVPHAYLGHKEGGYGPVNAEGAPNNTPKNKFNGIPFSSTQVAHLKDYIDVGPAEGGSVVGFAPGHVSSRPQNYLIAWDRGKVRGQKNKKRPWIDEGYKEARDEMKQVAVEEFIAVKGGLAEAPF